MSEYLPTPNYKKQTGYAQSLLNAITFKSDTLSAPAILLAKTTIISLMEKIQTGTLRVIDSERVYTFGNGSEPKATITVINQSFWLRMLLLSDLGFSESFMASEIDVDNLDHLFKVSHF